MTLSFDEHRLCQAKKIVGKITLPTQPGIVIEINKELRQEHPSFPRIASLVSQDASMSARVINVINSPFFGLAKKVDSIIQALTLMGLENFRKVVLTACLQEKLGGNSEEEKVFWEHSLHCAVAAEALARSIRGLLLAEGITPDQAYMAGLFHDIAIPILLKRSADYRPVVPFALSHKRDIIEEEDRLIGSDHCVIGGLLAKSWSVPEEVCKAIIHHHASNPSGHKNVPLKLIALIQMADYLAYLYDFSIGKVHRIIEGEWDLEEWAERHAATLDNLHLGVDDLADLKEDIFELLSRH
ncbi:HDOD domain-containing protein [Thiovibrio sp. JS02]